LTASVTEKTTAGTSRTSPDTAPVSIGLDSPRMVRAERTVSVLHCCRFALCGLLQFIHATDNLFCITRSANFCSAHCPCCGLSVLLLQPYPLQQMNNIG
jgi:hypothetical protein